jgi:hypothetical protein
MFLAFKPAHQQTIAAWYIATTHVGVRGIVAACGGKASINSGRKKISKNLQRGSLTQVARHKTYVYGISRKSYTEKVRDPLDILKRRAIRYIYGHTNAD